MKVSILDQSPVSSHQTPAEALEASMQLAKAGDKLGYERYWIAEHHDLSGLACSAPEVMLGYIGARTNRIRIGSGAVLLPHYKPYKVAETYNMLATLFPGRVDLGIGRAPGGSAEATNALSDNFLQQVFKMPELVEELLQFLDDKFPAEHEYAKLSASPLPPVPPEPWLLGTSKKSAELAARNGMAYTFGQFMSEQDGSAIIDQYKQAFQPRRNGDQPYAIVTVSVICAETAEQAHRIATSSLLWKIQQDKMEAKGVPSIEEAASYPLTEEEEKKMKKMKEAMIIGDPEEVHVRLQEVQARYGADELMLVTITHDPADRLKSYELVAEKCKK
ncbi:MULTISPECIES: LLM class flavin-dependent oxidoreductase [Priestia]|uniref:LLM class flavin-dependent oxidoreductase n=1 Tax=Priestia TaxID=2800373 RepID=UPI0028774BF2|nr:MULTISPECIES: LLM class flavin-dependent oxidoreductase [Priestia]MBX4162588.1 LLM class flavin-dependent oxidoreductase [Priestia megaterium]MED3897484.1 LLM class flavin-dependent oxidoreductase [Priestia aryabhattai]